MLKTLLMTPIYMLMTGMIAGEVCAQDYPNRPIRIVTVTPGSGSDFTSRIVAQGITGPMGQSVLVDNRASGVISKDVVRKSTPDGYTLLTSGSTLWMLPLLQGESFNLFEEFLPITLTDKSYNILVVHPSLPVKSVKELIALAKAKPGQLNIATGQTASGNHLAWELFKYMAGGIDIVRVPYKGGGLALTAVVSGETNMLFTNDDTALAHIKAGKLRALGVSSEQPTELTPGIPTIASTGLPGYEAASMAGVFAPAKTPPAIISRLNQEIVRVLKTNEVKERYLKAGVQAVGSSPEEFTTALKTDIARWSKVVKETGLKAQ